MDILERIACWAEKTPGAPAFSSPEGELTYGELWEASGRLCRYVKTLPGEGPLPVWGHKSPWMLVCFLALARAGRGYCPLDISIPAARAEAILSALTGPLFAVCPFPGQAPGEVLDLSEIRRICGEQEPEAAGESDFYGKAGEGREDPIFYVIFTSGSTGTPKGVMVSRGNLSRFVDWSLGLAGAAPGTVFLNQAPFSFDLSVMDLYTCLASGGKLVPLSRGEQGDYKLLMPALRESKAQVWVSTPSFAELCLADPSFCREGMPELSVMLFCGETLTNKTAKRLLSAFPGVRIVNTYGPTESTVAVTEVPVTGELVKREDPLPVGRPKPGTRIEIWDENGNSLPEGEKGEVVLWGDTVALGYLGREDLTGEVFLTREGERGYRTGDEGYLRDGMLYYGGRLDLQVKLHGYRIELGDIESALLSLPAVNQAVVLPRYRQGRVSSLLGVVVLAERDPDRAGTDPSGSEEALQGIRDSLREVLPEYMVPKKLCAVEEIPMTANGKADRKALAGRF